MTQAMHSYDEMVSRQQRAMTYIEPTDAEQKKLVEARTAILYTARFFAVFLFEEATLRWTRDPSVPTLATDGKMVLINPDYFVPLTVRQRVFAICHELAHVILAHPLVGYHCQQQGYITVEQSAKVLCEGFPAGTLPYSPKLANVAMDFVINALLTEQKIGERHASWLFNPKYTGDMSWVTVYQDIWNGMPEKAKQAARDQALGKGTPSEGQGQGSGVPGGQGSGAPGQGQQAGGSGGSMPDFAPLPSGTQGTEQFDTHMKPGEGSGQNTAEAAAERQARTETMKSKVMNAAAAARAAGQMSGTMQRFVDNIVEPPVDWRAALQTSCVRAMGGSGYDFKRGDRRFLARPKGQRMYVPAMSGNGAGTIVIAGDSSGSMGQAEFDMIFGCLMGIWQDARPQKIILIWCDSKVHRVDYVEDLGDVDHVKKLGGIGGGGTAFKPVFDWVEENGIQPDHLVYITDMYGPLDFEMPNYPVIWAAIAGKTDAPWGTVIEIPR